MSTVLNQDEARENIANNVQTLLRQHSLTQKELAQKLEVTEMAISRLLRKEHDPSAVLLANIADVLRVSVDFLLGKNSPKNTRRAS